MKNAAFLLMYIRRNSYTWEELGLLLKDFWWLAVFMVLLFVYSFRGYRQHMEEQREQERQREFWGDAAMPEKEVPEMERMAEPEEFTERQPRSRVEWRLMSNTFFIGLLLGINSWKGVFVDEGYTALVGFVLVLLVAVAMARNLPKNWIYTTFLDDKKEGRKPILGNVLRWLLPYGVALLAGLVVGMLAGLM